MLYLVKGNVKKPTEEFSDANKEKFMDLALVSMTLMVSGIKINLVPIISPELPQRDRSACFEDCF